MFGTWRDWKKKKWDCILLSAKGLQRPLVCFISNIDPAKARNRRRLLLSERESLLTQGGLDIKPSAGMRLMKKDMGGAAAVLALAQWVSASGYSRPCDFYLCLAENSVDAKAFRPSDLIRSRSGQLVEIDNTDAEGRLVLADGLDVAVTQRETPEIVIDVATLTGAIKVALGAEVAGLFSNDEQLGNDLFMAGLRAGDYNWKMPLVDRYFSSLHSHFSDFKNSADGFWRSHHRSSFFAKVC
jgi:leucyl aminopeptidase